jgi:hypothetical protein
MPHAAAASADGIATLFSGVCGARLRGVPGPAHGQGTRSEASDYHASYGTRIVLDAGEVARATREILEQHGIPSDWSVDLR